jgi:thiamine kinase-like enzyme
VLNQSKVELDSLPLISKSHHKVYSDGDVFLKKARSDEGSSEIVLEYSVQKLLGFESKLIPGPPVSLLTANYGDQLTSLTEDIVRESVRTMFQISETTKVNLKELEGIAPTVNDFRDKVERKIAWRVSEGRNPVKLFKILPEILEIESESLVLCHCDPRPENWLVNSDGHLVLIDWESAVLAPWEFAVVSYASYVYEYGNAELLFAVFEEALKIGPLKKDIVLWSAALRRVSVCSWYFDDEGFKVGDSWLKGLTEAFKGLTETW